MKLKLLNAWIIYQINTLEQSIYNGVIFSHPDIFALPCYNIVGQIYQNSLKSRLRTFAPKTSHTQILLKL